MRRRTGDVLAAAGLALAAFLLYHDILRLWWMNDDAYHLNVIAVTAPLDFLASARFWHSFVAPVFTPLLLLSLAADATLFGHDPHAFYLHQLAGVVLVAPLLYALLRAWFPRSVAFLAALTAMAGAPVLQIAGLLMLRHYVEGLVLAILAARVQVAAERRGSIVLAIAGAVLSLGAMLAKEVFVPLPFLLAFIPRGGTSTADSAVASEEDGTAGRARNAALLAPHACALVVYTVWRIALLGPALHGYGWTVQPRQWPRVVATLPWQALQTVAVHRAAGIPLVVLLVAALLLLVVKLPASRLPIAVAFVAALAPVIPLSIDLEPRYALGAWLLLVLAAAFSTRVLPRGGLALLALVAISALAANRVAWPEELRHLERMSREGRAYAALGPGDVLRNPAIPPAALGELQRLTGSRATGSYDDVFLCEGTIPATRLFAYDEHTRSVRESGGPPCGRIRDLPLLATFTTTGGDAFFWSLGPRAGGRYRFLLGTQAFDVPREGGFRLPTLRHVVLRIGYTSPDGAMTYSPGIALDLDRRAETRWAR